MSKIRKWKISWFVENAKTKEVLESVNCNDYIDRQTEKYEVLNKIRTKHKLQDDKFVFISEVK